MEDEIIVSEVLSEDEEKGKQIRIVVSTFRGLHYMHLREYYLGFEGEWLPSKNGTNIPVSIESMQTLFRALSRILADSELKFILDKVYEEIGTIPKGS